MTYHQRDKTMDEMILTLKEQLRITQEDLSMKCSGEKEQMIQLNDLHKRVAQAEASLAAERQVSYQP